MSDQVLVMNRGKIEEITDMINNIKPADDFRSRIEQIEDRLQ